MNVYVITGNTWHQYDSGDLNWVVAVFTEESKAMTLYQELIDLSNYIDDNCKRRKIPKSEAKKRLRELDPQYTIYDVLDYEITEVELR